MFQPVCCGRLSPEYDQSTLDKMSSSFNQLEIMNTYTPSLTLMAREHYYPCHRASYIIPRTISTPWGVCSRCCQMCSATSLIKHNYHLCPQRSPFILLGEEKQLLVKCLAQGHKHHSRARIRTHFLTTQSSQHKSDAVNRSTMAPPHLRATWPRRDYLFIHMVNCKCILFGD